MSARKTATADDEPRQLSLAALAQIYGISAKTLARLRDKGTWVHDAADVYYDLWSQRSRPRSVRGEEKWINAMQLAVDRERGVPRLS